MDEPVLRFLGDGLEEVRIRLLDSVAAETHQFVKLQIYLRK